MVVSMMTTSSFNRGSISETTLATTERLAAPIKAAGRLLVSESGIASRADLARLAPFGVDAVLVGEALVRDEDADIGARVRELASYDS